MGLTNENVGPKIFAKIKIYVLTRAELLFKVCYEIPCSLQSPWVPISSNLFLGPAKTSAKRTRPCSGCNLILIKAAL